MRGPVLSGMLAVLVAFSGCFNLESGDLTGDEPSSISEATGFLFYNARVWTADPAHGNATAVAVKGDRIVDVGHYEELEHTDLGERPMHMDLEGRMLLPGFIDTHTHFISVARRSDPAEGNPYETWEPGWDPVMGTVGQQETALEHIGTWSQNNLDRVMRGEAPDPPGAHDDHDDHDRHDDAQGHDHSHGLTDVLLKEYARALSLNRPLEGDDPAVVAAAQAGLLDDTLDLEGKLSANDLGFGHSDHEAVEGHWLDLLRLGLEAGAKAGVTSHVEAGIGLDAFDVLEQLEQNGELTARFNLYVFPEELDNVVDRGWTTGHGTDKARLLGLKIYSDGWLGPRTAALSELYNDRPHRGFAFYTQEEVNDYVLRAHQNGLKLTAHTIGDRAAEMLVTAYENALEAGCETPHQVCEDPRFTLEHVQLVPPSLLDRMVGIDLVPSIQLSFATSDSPWAEMAVGEERLEQAYIWRTMTERGLTLAGSSDFPIEVMPPLWGIQRMVTRMDLDGYPEGGFYPEQALELDQVLRMVTINAAKLTYQEDRLGSITPGKLADLIVLEEDLFQIPPDEIHTTDVELTMVDGQVVHMGGPFHSTSGRSS